MFVTLKFTPSAHEFLEAQLAYNKFFARRAARFTYRYAIPLGLLFVAEGLLGFALSWNIVVCVLLIAFGGYQIFAVKFWGPRRIKKEFEQYPDHTSEKVMEFGDEMILVQTSHGRSEIAWERFSRFVETDKLFVLFGPPRQLLTIPKRSLTADNSDRFRELLRRKLVD